MYDIKLKMRAVEYIEAFPRILPAYEADLAEPWGLEGPHEQSLGWSYMFGKMVHDNMRGTKPTFSAPSWDKYSRWNVGGLDYQMEPFHTSEDAVEERNTANFHALNRSMLVLWSGLLPADVQANLYLANRVNHRFALKYAQQALAFEATNYLLDREEFIEEAGGTHGLFSQRRLPDGRQVPSGGFTEVVQGATGVIQEFETAICGIQALLDHPKLLGKDTVLLPAPIQFEKTARATNADFIYYDPTYGAERAVGLQTKMGVTEEDMEAIDSDRVVLIDGKIDFNSVRPLRAAKASSRERVVAWPGMIAAKVASDFRITGKNPSPIIRVAMSSVALQAGNKVMKGSGLNGRAEMAARMEALQAYRYISAKAKKFTAGMKVDLPGLSKIIAERVAPKL